MISSGPLNNAQRLLARMIGLLEAAVKKINAGGAADMELVWTAVDCIQSYADRLHADRKDIYFLELAQVNVSGEYRKIMGELIGEHGMGRGLLRNLIAARAGYRQGDKGAMVIVSENLKALESLFLRHDRKEDEQFFIPVMNYLSPGEQAAMLNEFGEFGRRYIQRYYQNTMAKLDGKKSVSPC